MPKRLICQNLPTPGKSTTLSEDESHHATRVLRLREGDTVEVIDGRGNLVHAALRRNGKYLVLEHLKSYDDSLESQKRLPITLEMTVLKGDAMEWIVEKSVELGVQHFVPIITDHTVVQMKAKGPQAFQERWQKIADQALKQCGRLERMEVSLPISLEAQILKTSQENKMVRIVGEESTREQSPYLMDWLQLHPPVADLHWRILLGPEGGWSTPERELFSREAQHSPLYPISLGPLILRAETAAVFSVSLISAHCRKKP